MAHHELIDTPRLRLTRPHVRDAPAIFERYASDPEVVKYVGFPRHQSVADTEAFIHYSDDEWRRGGAGPYLVWSRVDGTLLGGTGLGFEAVDRVTTGYVLATDAWGKGYATESLRAMIDLAGTLGVPRLIAGCHPDNRASIRVLEKCGFAVDAASPVPLMLPNIAPGATVDGLQFSRDIRAGDQA